LNECLCRLEDWGWGRLAPWTLHATAW